MSDDRIRVLVVAESPLARAGLEAALSHSDRFEVVGTCDAAASAAMFDSTGAAAVLMEGGTFSAWSPGETASDPLPPAALTPREIDVLRLLSGGSSNKIIAHQLSISEHTVKFHVTSILAKLNAGSRTEAVTLGVRMGLVYL